MDPRSSTPNDAPLQTRSIRRDPAWIPLWVRCAHRADKWTRFSAPNDAPFKKRGASDGSPKSGFHFGSDALSRSPTGSRSGRRLYAFWRDPVVAAVFADWAVLDAVPSGCRSRPSHREAGPEGCSARASPRRPAPRKSSARRLASRLSTVPVSVTSQLETCTSMCDASTKGSSLRRSFTSSRIRSSERV